MFKKSIFFVLVISFFSCNLSADKSKEISSLIMNEKIMGGLELATFANGCFWCSEAIFQQLDGVSEVVSGYAGGTVKKPTYKEVVTGNTNHAEVIRIIFDPKIINYRELLEVFFSTHDPTTLNRQGADVGTQYRSAIFYHSEFQKVVAEKVIKELEEEGVFDNAIVTEITQIQNYYPAENYHQDYYKNNKNQGYCRAVINPKLEKFRKKFKNKLRKE